MGKIPATMYGLINQSIQNMIESQCGTPAWERVRARAGVPGDFSAMEQYPDELTSALIDAASIELGQPRTEVMESFGRFWTLHTARRGYAELLGALGDSFVTALQNLDVMHGRIALTFPRLRPPSFRCSDITATRLRLHYYSDRAGLTSFVVGLIKGLAEVYGTTIVVTQADRKPDEMDHEVFEIHLG